MTRPVHLGALGISAPADVGAWKAEHDQIVEPVGIDVQVEAVERVRVLRQRIPAARLAELDGARERRPDVPQLLGHDVEVAIAIDVEHAHTLGAERGVEHVPAEPERFVDRLVVAATRHHRHEDQPAHDVSLA